MHIGIDSNMSCLTFILDKIFTDDYRLANLTGKPDVSAKPWINLHDRIKPTSKPSKIRQSNSPSKESKQSLMDENISFALPKEHSLKLSVGIDKNSILSKYQYHALRKEFYQRFLLS